MFQAIEKSDFFAICISRRAVTKSGFIQNEIRTAIDEYRRRPAGTIYLLPILLEACEIPRIRLDANTLLKHLQWTHVASGDSDSLDRLSEGILTQLKAGRTAG
ncbi:MAG: TIR domain-containing protein [Synechococcus sp.]